MANIKINNLKVTGSELFVDQESFLSELSDSDLAIQGGFSFYTWTRTVNNPTIYEN